MTSERPLILAFSHFEPFTTPSCDGCEIPFEVTTDRRRLGEADAVLFHVPTWSDACDVPKRRGQRFVALALESETNYPRLADPKFMARFDFTMTYRQDASVWWPYFGPETAEALRRPLRPKSADALLAWFASGPVDRSGRTRWAFEIMKRVRTHSYGRILRNRSLPADAGRETKLAVIADYKFTLAFENSIGPDYVTEKFFDALIAGSVPVYLGAPNVAEFAPGRSCYIDANDFAGPGELAAFLLQLASNDRAYGEYHAWRSEPFAQSFIDKLQRVSADPFCRLARLLHAAVPAK